MTKKIIALTVALLLLVSALASCKSTKDESTTPAETTPAATTPATTTPEETTPEGNLPENTPTEITLQEVYDAGKNLLALRGDHENVYTRVTSEGKVIREDYLSKQYAYVYYGADFMDMGFEYSSFITDTATYSYFDGLYVLDVTLTPDGIVEKSDLLTSVGTSDFVSPIVLTAEDATIVEENGFIIVSISADPEELTLTDDGVVSCVETYTLDAKTREMVSIKTVYTYEDGTTEEGVVTITRDVETPESAKPFLEIVQETEDMRTVTIVSNPGTENEKTESIQVPKGLQVALGNDWGVEETFSVYEDAACTQL